MYHEHQGLTLTVWTATGLLIAGICGCGAGADNVDVYPVKGTVRFEGKPMVGGGSISFIPDIGQKGKAAGGTIREDGTYELSTYEPGDGSMSGGFRVVITQTVWNEPEYAGDTDEGGGAGPEPELLVPEEDQIPVLYSNPQQSPLTATVVPAPGNEIDFDLER